MIHHLFARSSEFLGSTLPAGISTIGWKPYSGEDDVALFFDTPTFRLPVGPGTFAIFFPDDVHKARLV